MMEYLTLQGYTFFLSRQSSNLFVFFLTHLITHVNVLQLGECFLLEAIRVSIPQYVRLNLSNGTLNLQDLNNGHSNINLIKKKETI